MDFNLDSLTGALELAGDAGTATGKVAKGFETVKALFKSSENSADADIKLAMSDLTVQIANAQVANSELKFKLAALQNELAEAKAFQSDLYRYELWETPAGAVVYRLKKTTEEHEPEHYLCPSCIEVKRKSILQGHASWRKCPVCTTGFYFEKSTGISTVKVRRSSRFDGC